MAFASKIPTQIGSTRSLATSFRTMMGMLVTGSIIRPRICISTSSGACVCARVGWPLASLVQHNKVGDTVNWSEGRSIGRGRQRLADQTVRQRLRNPHLNVAPQRRVRLRKLRRRKVDGLVLACCDPRPGCDARCSFRPSPPALHRGGGRSARAESRAAYPLRCAGAPT